MNNTEVPLMYTSKGNLPLSALEERVNWKFIKDREERVTEVNCVIEHWHAGACVRRQCNVYMTQGPEAVGSISNVG